MSKQAYLLANVERAIRQLEGAGLVFRREDINFMWSKGRELTTTKTNKLEGTCLYSPKLDNYTITLNNRFLTHSKKKKYNKKMIDIIQHELIHYYCREYFIDFLGLENANVDTCPVFLGLIFWLKAKKGIKVFGGSNMDYLFNIYHKTLCKDLKECETFSNCKSTLKLYYKTLQSIIADFETKMKKKMYNFQTLCSYSVNWYDRNRDYSVDHETHAEITYINLPKESSGLNKDYSVPYYNIYISVDFSIDDNYLDEEEGLFMLFDNENIEEALMCDIVWQIEEPKHTILSDSILEEVRKINEKKLA